MSLPGFPDNSNTKAPASGRFVYAQIDLNVQCYTENRDRISLISSVACLIQLATKHKINL
jgi:hypothetical protein